MTLRTFYKNLSKISNSFDWRFDGEDGELVRGCIQTASGKYKACPILAVHYLMFGPDHIRRPFQTSLAGFELGLSDEDILKINTFANNAQSFYKKTRGAHRVGRKRLLECVGLI